LYNIGKSAGNIKSYISVSSEIVREIFTLCDRILKNLTEKNKFININKFIFSFTS